MKNYAWLLIPADGAPPYAAASILVNDCGASLPPTEIITGALIQLSDCIQARAVRRMGELYKSFNAQGQRADKLIEAPRLRGVGFDEELIDRGNSTHETPVYLNVTLREVNADGKESKGPRTGSGVYCCGRRVGRSDSDLLYGFRAGNGSPTPRDYDGYSRVG